MTRFAPSNLQHRRILRLLALLLALLVAMSSLTTHAAIQADSVDCIAVEQLHEATDSEEHNCGTCTAVIPRTRLALTGPAEQTATPDASFMPHSSLPPQRPPRA
ncbi:hypothetical protein [Billgrantia desiderata]|uniref:hypothetical protein n=1 Tax=Billgrantia desiderata TaxID=52021 RepID=UPI00089F84F5|nr:hypothetical protein [Halomonas desiderata]SEG47549.1 hypothetical protein SAMN04487953_13818 [Halomonas desiderata]